MCNFNINNCNKAGTFESAIEYANQYRNISGVDEILATIQENFQEYRIEIKEFMEQERPIVEVKFAKLNSISKKKVSAKKIGIVCLIISFISMFIPFHSTFISIIVLLIMIAGVLGVFVTIILKIYEIILEKIYSSCMKLLMSKSEQVNEKYLDNIKYLRNRIDNLYLNSLDPAHRELVLMRREQKQQHEQLMYQQRQHQIAVEEEQRRHQITVEEEQRKIRYAQEELLEIERERERRYKY